MILSLIAGVVVAVLAGLGMIGLDRIGFYIVVAVPLLAGAMTGMAIAIPSIRFRSPIPPQIVLAILCGLVTVAVYWYGSYQVFVEEVVTEIQRATPSATREEAIDLMDRIMLSEYGVTGIQGFVADAASVGVNITRTLSSSEGSGIELKDTLAYVYWGVEALLIIGTAIAVVIRRDRMAKALLPKTDTGGLSSPIQ